MKQGMFPGRGLRRGGQGAARRSRWSRRRSSSIPKRIPRGLNDSKKLNPETRAALYEKICSSAQVAVAIAPPARIEIDNIRGASLWALARAVKALPVTPKLVFVDGIDRIDVDCECRAGDQRRRAGALDRRRIDRRQGDARPADGLRRRRASGLRLRAPHGLFGAGAFRGAQSARPLRAPSPQVRAGRGAARPARDGRGS